MVRFLARNFKAERLPVVGAASPNVPIFYLCDFTINI